MGRKLRDVCVCVVAAMLSFYLVGCGSRVQESPAQNEAEPAQEQMTQKTSESDVPANGTYDIEVETDSSMFRSESCVLSVEDGTYTATLSLPGEGFSKLFFGTAEDAASAADEDVYAYHLNDAGKYTFDLPVSALDEELPIAAFGQRRNTWYDHTITFHAPAAD